MIGMSLHELEDFYAHSNWVEEPGVTGADGRTGPGSPTA